MGSWRPSAFTVVALSAAFAVVANWATNTVQVSAAWWPPVVWATTIGLVGVSIWVEVARRRSETPALPPTATQLDTLAAQLAQAVRERWRREEEHRKVTDPVPLPVRWHPASDDLVDDPANICHTPLGHPAGRLTVAGSLDQIAEIYQRLPSGRLVILGKPGAGKTVLAARLALDLLAVRQPTQPVPVIFSVGSWDPATPLRDWLAGQLARDHPALAAPGAGGSSLAAALLATDRILPILDGFDEINPGLHPAALRQLNTATGLPLVLTSRPEQYTTAVRDVDVLTHAEGIELDDLTVSDLTGYLPRTSRRRTSDGVGVWQPVLTRLGEDPPDPAAAVLRRVLSTPLMVYLARTIYSDTPGYNPAELLDPDRSPTEQAVQEHLIGAYLPAVYQQRPATGRYWPADRAQHWLTYLAEHLHRLGTQDLAWWQLRDTIPRPTRILLLTPVVGLVFGLAVGLSLGLRGSGLVGGLVGGLVFGLGSGLVFGLRVGLARAGPPPARIHVKIRGRIMELFSRLVSGLLFGLWLWLWLGLVGQPRSGLGFWIGGGLVIGLVWLMEKLKSPIEMTAVVNAGDSLRVDRSNTIRQMLVFELVFGLAGGLVVEGGVVFGLVFGLVVGLMVGLVVGLAGAWGQWLVLIRVWLPLTGRLPWRVYAFLSDTYHLGVLRQAGPVYQFRHARLQDHLTRHVPPTVDR